MTNKHEKEVSKLKALSDTNRLLIVEMLSCGELCACEILTKFKITQPTLSHHMKILCGCGLVQCRKEGKNTFYRLNDSEVHRFSSFIENLFSDTTDCICK